VAVEVDPSLASTLPPEELRRAVSRELAAPVAEPGSMAPARGRLEVRRVAADRALLVWRDAAGREATRELDLASAGWSPEVIALLAATLARNEVDELIVDGTRTVTMAEVREVPMVEVPMVEVPPPVFPRFFLGLDVQVGSVGRSDGAAPYLIPGLVAGYRLASWLKVGLTSITLSTENARWAVSAAPYAELSFRWRRLEPFVQLGALTQVRVGNGLKAAGGCALFAGLGARLWLGTRVTLGVSFRLHAVATDYLQVLSQLLPQRALMFTGGLELGVSL
jgi:hypothetical protein